MLFFGKYKCKDYLFPPTKLTVFARVNCSAFELEDSESVMFRKTMCRTHDNVFKADGAESFSRMISFF